MEIDEVEAERLLVWAVSDELPEIASRGGPWVWLKMGKTLVRLVQDSDATVLICEFIEESRVPYYPKNCSRVRMRLSRARALGWRNSTTGRSRLVVNTRG